MYKCIVVEDEKNIRQRLVSHFPWEEFQVEIVGEAENGIEAIKLIEKYHPHLIFTDIKMPEMDGLELAKEIHLRFPNIITILVSAYNEFNYAQKAIEYNVKGYLLKPILKKEFIQLMTKIYSNLQKTDLLIENKDLEDKTLGTKNTENTRSKDLNQYIYFAKNYVNEHYAKPISLKNICSELYISESYFSSLFSQETGVGFANYVNEVRIEKSKELLKYSNDSLKVIALKVGFSSPSYFNKVFKSITGMSPLEFKKSGNSDEYI